MHEQLLIYAKKRGEIHAQHNPRNYNRPSAMTILFDLTIKPTTPLRLGLTVRIHEIKDIPIEVAITMKKPLPPYRAEATGIVGTITGVRMIEQKVTQFVLEHQDNRYASHVKYAYISVPHIPGVTLDLPTMYTWMRWLALPYLYDTHSIALEEDAVVVDREVPWREEYPDSEAWD